MTHYQKGILVMDFLEDLGVNMLAIGRAIDDSRFDQTYKLITENPQITKAEFLEKMQISEE